MEAWYIPNGNTEILIIKDRLRRTTTQEEKLNRLSISINSKNFGKLNWGVLGIIKHGIVQAFKHGRRVIDLGFKMFRSLEHLK